MLFTSNKTRKCFVKGCGVVSSGFVRFPKNLSMKQRWLNVLGVDSCSADDQICTKHFEPGFLVYSNGAKRMRISREAIPSLDLPSIPKKEEKLYECDRCKCKYAHPLLLHKNKKQAEVIEKRASFEKPWGCDKCDMRYYQYKAENAKEKLLKHEPDKKKKKQQGSLKPTMLKEFMCDLCNKIFKDQNYLDIHKMGIHGVSKPSQNGKEPSQPSNIKKKVKLNNEVEEDPSVDEPESYHDVQIKIEEEPFFITP